MSTWNIGIRAVATGFCILLGAGSGTAAWICPPPINCPPVIPRPTPQPPESNDPLMGTEYKISGFNSRLPGPNSPATVKFDGVAESVGNYIVNESIRRIVNERGERETWVDFEFTLDPRVPPSASRSSSMIAEDTGERWRVNLADLSLPSDASIPEFYMYFTEQGSPAPFGRRSRRGDPSFAISDHPFLEDVDVWRGPLTPLKPGDLPPGARNALVTNFDHYFSTVHDVERGLGVSRNVDGFRLGYRVNIPEPSTFVVGALGMLCSLLGLRRRRSPERS